MAVADNENHHGDLTLAAKVGLATWKFLHSREERERMGWREGERKRREEKERGERGERGENKEREERGRERGERWRKLEVVWRLAAACASPGSAERRRLGGEREAPSGNLYSIRLLPGQVTFLLQRSLPSSLSSSSSTLLQA